MAQLLGDSAVRAQFEAQLVQRLAGELLHWCREHVVRWRSHRHTSRDAPVRWRAGENRSFCAPALVAERL
jgi:hypothetical protein